MSEKCYEIDANISRLERMSEGGLEEDIVPEANDEESALSAEKLRETKKMDSISYPEKTKSPKSPPKTVERKTKLAEKSPERLLVEEKLPESIKTETFRALADNVENKGNVKESSETEDRKSGQNIFENKDYQKVPGKPPVQFRTSVDVRDIAVTSQIHSQPKPVDELNREISVTKLITTEPLPWEQASRKLRNREYTGIPDIKQEEAAEDAKETLREIKSAWEEEDENIKVHQESGEKCLSSIRKDPVRQIKNAWLEKGSPEQTLVDEQFIKETPQDGRSTILEETGDGDKIAMEQSESINTLDESDKSEISCDTKHESEPEPSGEKKRSWWYDCLSSCRRKPKTDPDS
ncbi:uncharacterized protein O3C94_013038 [Discoglossus pictus]